MATLEELKQIRDEVLQQQTQSVPATQQTTAGGPVDISSPTISATTSLGGPASPQFNSSLPVGTGISQEQFNRGLSGIGRILPSAIASGLGFAGALAFAPETGGGSLLPLIISRGIIPALAGGTLAGITEGGITGIENALGKTDKNPIVEGLKTGTLDAGAGVFLGGIPAITQPLITRFAPKFAARAFASKLPLLTPEERIIANEAIEQGIDLTPQQISGRNFPGTTPLNQSKGLARRLANQQKQVLQAEENLAQELGIRPLSTDVTVTAPTISDELAGKVNTFRGQQSLPTTSEIGETVGEAQQRIGGAFEKANKAIFDLRDEGVQGFIAGRGGIDRALNKLAAEGKGLPEVESLIKSINKFDLDKLDIENLKRLKRLTFVTSENAKNSGKGGATVSRLINETIVPALNRAEDSILAKATGKIPSINFKDKTIQTALSQFSKGGGKAGIKLRDVKKIINNRLKLGKINQDTATRALEKAKDIDNALRIQKVRANLPSIETLNKQAKAFFSKNADDFRGKFAQKLADVVENRPADLAKEFATPEDLPLFIKLTGAKGKQALADQFVSDLFDAATTFSRTAFSEGSEKFTAPKALSILKDNPNFVKNLLGEQRAKDLTDFFQGITDEKVRDAVFRTGGAFKRTPDGIKIDVNAIAKNLIDKGGSQRFTRQELNKIGKFVKIANKTGLPDEQLINDSLGEMISRFGGLQVADIAGIRGLQKRALISSAAKGSINIFNPTIDVTRIPLKDVLKNQGKFARSTDLIRGAQATGLIGADVLQNLANSNQNNINKRFEDELIKSFEQ